jgi:hypothetical protein
VTSPYSIDFVIENGSEPSCSSCVFYLGFSYLGDTDFGLQVSWQGESISWNPGECGTDCGSVTDPSHCCPSCGRPIETVRKLVPGERLARAWDATKYITDRSVCSCGCTRRSAIGEGSGRARICYYKAFECVQGTFAGGCPAESDGFIRGAVGSGPTACVEAPFSFPADSGGKAVLTLK